jgi:hypothetical protein
MLHHALSKIDRIVSEVGERDDHSPAAAAPGRFDAGGADRGVPSGLTEVCDQARREVEAK